MEEVKKEAAEPRKLNFLEEIIEADLKSGKVDSILTRFPPEPGNPSDQDGIASDCCPLSRI